MKKSVQRALAASAAALGACALLAPTAAAASPKVNESEFIAQVTAYANEHPADVEGFQELVRQLGGTSTASSQTLRLDEVPGLDPSTLQVGGVTTLGNFPSDVFTVNIVSGSVGATKIVTGSFNWRNNFAGQAAPLDFAALRFSSGCGTMTGHTSATKNLRGVSTNRATLRSAGVGTNAPIWNVNATTSGFENQADVGAFTVKYNTTGCGTKKVQAAFDYEANQGGSVISVGAGWGGLSVSYNGVGLELTKSSNAITIN